MKPSSVLAQRYIEIANEALSDCPDDYPCTNYSHLVWMCETIIEQEENWPADKTGRWLGFVQGCFASRGLIDVEEERELSRPLFHRSYKKQKIDIPVTFERK